MARRYRDSKFIIYQVLYIFVITVLALKGADLNLSRVVMEDKAVDITVKDSLVALIDSLYAQGLNFDIKIDDSVIDENQELRQKLASMNQQMSSLTKKIKEIPVEDRTPEVKEPPVKDQTLEQLPLSETQTFIQNTWNVARNNGNVPSYIYDPGNLNTPLAVIQPGQEGKFDLTDQSEIVVKFGSQQQKLKVLPNKPPQVKIEKVTTHMDGRDIYVRELQRVTAFTVTIFDERPDQLKINHSGPISVTGPVMDSKGNPVYNVSLNLATSKQRFDDWLDKNENSRTPDGRYKAVFFFTVIDEKTNDRVQVGDQFIFTRFSK
jgi:hypothetical protein